MTQSSVECCLSTMKSPSYLCLLISMILASGIDNLFGQNVAEKRLHHFNISDLLFGKVWKFNQYCGYYRSDDEILQDDIDIRRLHNGSLLEVATTFEQYNGAVQVGIKAKQALPMICSINSWGYADSSTELISNEPLDKESQEVCSKMLASTSYKDFRWMYNTARVPAGGLFRQQIWLGDYDDCLRAGNQQTANSSTRYCFAAFTDQRAKSIKPNVNGFRVGLCAPKSCTSRLLLAQKSYLDRTFKTSNGLDALETSSLACLLENYTLTDFYCPPSEGALNRQMPSDNLSLVIYILASVWLSVLVYGTLAGFLSQNSPDNNNKSLTTIIRKVFDLRLNWTELFHVDDGGGGRIATTATRTTTTEKIEGEEEQRNDNSQQVVKSDHQSGDELAGLNGVKVIAMNWLMLSHIYGLMTSYSINSFYDDNGYESSRWDRYQILRALVYQGQHLPPGFFLISGLLAGRKYLIGGGGGGGGGGSDSSGSQTTTTTTTTGNLVLKRRVGGDINVFRMILLRYIRLVPMYLVVYVLIKRFQHLLGSGPLWDYGVSVQSETRQCQQESWLVPLLMISNFIPPFSHCIITGWHISNDFQIYLVLPFLLMVYRSKSSIVGYPVGRILALVAFIITHLSHVYNWHQAGNFAFEQVADEPFLFGSRLIVDRLAFDYVNPLGRIGTYFLGVVLGELLFFDEKSSMANCTEMSTRDKSNQLLSELNKSKNTNNGQQSSIGFKNNENEKQEKIGYMDHHFKASLMFTFGSFMFITCMLSVVGPNDIKHLLGAYSKSISYPTVRLAAELGWASLLYGLVRGNARGSAWLKWPIWKRLIKLNYTIMLIHFTVFRCVVQTQRQLFIFNYTNYFKLASYVILLAYLIALIVHLTIEVPLNKLIRLYVITKINRLYR